MMTRELLARADEVAPIVWEGIADERTSYYGDWNEDGEWVEIDLDTMFDTMINAYEWNRDYA